MTPEPSEPSVPSRLDVSKNVESVASDEELSAAMGMSGPGLFLELIKSSNISGLHPLAYGHNLR